MSDRLLLTNAGVTLDKILFSSSNIVKVPIGPIFLLLSRNVIATPPLISVLGKITELSC